MQISSDTSHNDTPPKQALTKSEKKQLRKLERDIEKLETKKTALTTQLCEPGLHYSIIQEISAKIKVFVDQINEKTEKWSQLADKA
jgi:ATP-binding cassette subfamily F protein uup